MVTEIALLYSTYLLNQKSCCSIFSFLSSFLQIVVCPYSYPCPQFVLPQCCLSFDLQILITHFGIFKLFFKDWRLDVYYFLVLYVKISWNVYFSLFFLNNYKLLYVIFHMTCHINPRRPYQPKGRHFEKSILHPM